MKIEQAENAIGYTFKDKSLLSRALTLSSASGINNERLEFFGDAILEFIVSEHIYNEEESEGVMTERRKNLVSDEALRPVSVELGLDKMLVRGKNDDTNKKAIPSAFEAVVAAIYLDGGMEEARKFVLSKLDFSKKDGVVNYKGKLQEIIQPLKGTKPQYTSKDIGTPQKHVFEASVKVFGKTFSGEADNIKSSEQIAARHALEYYEKADKSTL